MLHGHHGGASLHSAQKEARGAVESGAVGGAGQRTDKTGAKAVLLVVVLIIVLGFSRCSNLFRLNIQKLTVGQKTAAKTGLKRWFQARKLVAGAGFVPRHAGSIAHFPCFSRQFAHTRSLPGRALALQFGVRFGVRWRRRL